MKYLCICHFGHSRSVAIARALHGRGLSAVAIGAHSSGDAVVPLAAWADVIFAVDPTHAYQVPAEYRHKVKAFPLGPDVWSNPYHHDLIAKVDALLKEHGL